MVETVSSSVDSLFAHLPLLLELLRLLLDECDELQEDDEDEDDEEDDELEEDEDEDLLRLCFLFRFSRPKREFYNF